MDTRPRVSTALYRLTTALFTFYAQTRWRRNFPQLSRPDLSSPLNAICKIGFNQVQVILVVTFKSRLGLSSFSCCLWLVEGYRNIVCAAFRQAGYPIQEKSKPTILIDVICACQNSVYIYYQGASNLSFLHSSYVFIDCGITDVILSMYYIPHEWMRSVSSQIIK